MALGVVAPAASATARVTVATPAASLERQKLDLEIRKLRQETSREGRARPFIPLAGVVVTVVLALIGLGRWLADRKDERRLRIEEQTAKHIDGLVDGRLSPAASLASLRALHALSTAKLAGDDAESQVTDVLVALVRDDIVPMDTAGKVVFPVGCLDQWPPYGDRLRAAPGACRAVVGAYGEVLRNVHQRSPQFVSQARQQTGGAITGPGTISGADRRLLEVALDGYRRHVALLPGEDRAEFEEDLGRILYNDVLGEEVAP
jgi:hypothetical protein